MTKKRPKWIDGRRDEIRRRQDNKCAECGKHLDADNYQIHHVVPWSEINPVGLEYFDTITANPRLKKRMMKGLLNDTLLDGPSDGRNLQAVHDECHKEIHARMERQKRREAREKEIRR